MKVACMFGAALALLVSPVQARPQADSAPRTCAQPDMTDAQARTVLEHFSLDSMTSPQQIAGAFAAVENAAAAECVMRQWPAEFPPRELVRSALVTSAAVLRIAEARRSGNSSDVSLIPSMITVINYADSLERRVVGDQVWAVAQMGKFDVISGMFRDLYAVVGDNAEMAAAIGNVRRAVDAALAEPVLATAQNRPILLAHRARTYWVRSGLVGGASISAPIADYELAVQAFLDLGQRELALDTALESIDLVTSFGESPQAGLAALRSLDGRFTAAELRRRHVFEREMNADFRASRPAALLDSSRRWFEALKNDLRVAGAPVWAVDSRQHQLFLVAPAQLDIPNVPEAFARMDELAQLSRAGNLELRSFELPHLPVPSPGQDGSRGPGSGLDITQAATLDRLGVDAIVMPVWVQEVIPANFTRIFTGDRSVQIRPYPLRWLSISKSDPADGRTRQTVTNVPFAAEALTLNEYGRSLASSLPVFVDMLNSDATADQRARIQEGFRGLIEREVPRAEPQFDIAFGRAIDSALGNRCSQGGATGAAIPRVLLILPASLDYFPVQLARAANGRRLIECYEFRRVPDLAAALRTADARRSRPAVRRIVGVWNPSGGMEMALAERAMMVQSAGPRNVEVDSAAAGSTASLLRSEPRADIVHIAAHGRVGWLDPYRSGFALAGGTTLRAIDLLNGRETTNAGLVVLPACESGLTSSVFGEVGRFGLPAGLLEAGAGGVVAALWRVRDDATALVMARFYELLLADGLPPADALRRAQLWLRDQSTDQLVDYLLAREAGAPARDRESIATLRAAVIANAGQAGGRAPYSDPLLWGGFAYFGTYAG